MESEMTEQKLNLEIENPVTSKELVELLPIHFEAGDAVFVWGDSGIGKSELSDQIAKAQGRRKIDFRLNIREPVDLRGLPVPDLAKLVTQWLVPSELPKSDGSDGPTLLVLDEMNTGTMQMMAVAMQLVLDKAIAEYTLPSNCAVLAMGNRSKDSRAVVQMPKPLRNRFVHYTMIVDHDAWVAHCKRTNLAPEIIAFIRFRPEYLIRQPQGDENAYASPRSVYRCGKYVNQPPRLRLKIFIGLVGKDVGTEMESFVAMYQSLANIDDILTHPKTAKLPTEASERYAVATAIARLANRSNFANVITYAKRIGETHRDIEVLAVTDAASRDPKLTEIAAYANWAVANQDVTVQ
jgi:hypothetical protein